MTGVCMKNILAGTVFAIIRKLLILRATLSRTQISKHTFIEWKKKKDRSQRKLKHNQGSL